MQSLTHYHFMRVDWTNPTGIRSQIYTKLVNCNGLQGFFD